MTTRTEFDQQLRSLAHTALREMSATPRVTRRPLGERRRSLAPLAVAAGIAAAAAAVAVPILASHSLHGGSATPPPPHESGKPAGTILRDMTEAMGRLRSYHMVLHGTATTGGSVAFDVRLDRKGNVAETMTAAGVRDAMAIVDGTLYISGPDLVPQEWQAAAGDHWVSMPATDLGQMATTFIGPAHMIDCLTGTPGALSTTGEHTVNGLRTVRVVSTRSDAGTTGFTVDVADTGQPYAVRLESSDGANGRPGCNPPAGSQAGVPVGTFPGTTAIDFDDFDTTTLIPAPSDVIDSATLPQLTH